MHYPGLKAPQTSRQMVDVFRGYDHNPRIPEGAFYEMENMSSRRYPILCPRQRRSVYARPSSCGGLIAKDVLCYVDGADFVIGRRRVHMELSEGEKQLVSMGGYVVIFPDKKYVNTADPEDFGPLEAVYSSAGKAVSLCPCDLEGNVYAGASVSADPPEDPENLELWVDTNQTPHVLKRYAATSEMWVSIATTYVKISAPGIGKDFKVYDGVTISGIRGEGLEALNMATVIWGCEEDSIIVPGLVDELFFQLDAPVVGGEDRSITVARTLPEMDFVIASGNRLWGCRYGLSAKGEMVNEIYASKLGDFRNWNCFMGLSTDSYAAGCGSDGPFTGAFTQGQPLFFKEGCIHRVYGTIPANFQIQTVSCRGVQNGCQGSLANVGGTLLYKSPGGVCAWDGGMPTEIGQALGGVFYKNARAGALGSKYYISMEDGKGKWHLFVYDKARGLWHREDAFAAEGFAGCNGELYALKDNVIWAITGSEGEREAPISWMVETGPLGMELPDRKYVSSLAVRLSMEPGSQVRISIRYDSLGGWEHICTLTGRELRSFSLPVRPRRCDHLQLRLEGRGDAGIYSIVKTLERGSDRM